MPEGTRVHRCVEKLKGKKGVDNPFAICQSSTHQSFATGKSTRKSDGKKVGSESMSRAPSLQVMGIAANSDPALFENLMSNMGMRVVRRRVNDPLNTSVQEEAVMAVASAICEDTNSRMRLTKYQRALKEMAERAGYIVMLEFAPDEFEEHGTGDDPMSPDGPVGEGEAMIAAGEGGEPKEGPPLPGEGPMGGPMGGPMDGEMASPEEEMVAQIPIGADLAREILAVVKGEGTAGMDSLVRKT
jgi:hypothetical protein